MQKFILFLFIFILVFPLIIFARIGVGMGVGKIQIDTPLKSGGIYDFSPLVVFNTGGEISDYEIEVTYHSRQPEMRPSQEWFSFSPYSFSLEPGKSQTVGVKLTLPVKTKPGDYFAYLEAHPIIKAAKPGTATVGVAAATKLYFTVIPSNVWQAIYFRFLSLWTRYVPWNWIVLGLALVAVLIVIFRKFFKFDIGVKVSKK